MQDVNPQVLGSLISSTAAEDLVLITSFAASHDNLSTVNRLSLMCNKSVLHLT